MLRAVRCDKALEVRSLPALGQSVPHFCVDGIVHIPAARALCVGALNLVPLMPEHPSFDAWRAWAASAQMHLPAPLDAVLGPAVWIRLDENGAGAYCDLELHMWQAALERLHQPSHCAAQVRTLLGYERNKAAAKCKRVVGSAEGNAPAHASPADAKAVPKAAKKPMPKKTAKAAESDEDSSDGTYVQSDSESDSESDSRTESSEDASCASETLSDSEGSVSAASSEDAAGSESEASNESSDSDDSDDGDDGARAQKTRGIKSGGRTCSKTL